MAKYVLCCFLIFAAGQAGAAEPFTLEVSVNGQQRSALVYPGRKADKEPSPVVMYFHGFSGTSDDSARKTGFHKVWPGAIVVYPQGLKDIGAADNKNYGWQRFAGNLGDRDLHFVDAIIKELSERYKVNSRTIYATGHSNGGFLTFALLTARSSTLAAFAPVGSYNPARESLPDSKPCPVLYIFGKEDHVFDRDPDCPNGSLDCAQKTLQWLIEFNQCSDKPARWYYPGFRKYLPGPSGKTVVWNLHKGGHSWPDHATKTIVRFFKEDARQKSVSNKDNDVKTAANAK